MPGSPSGGTIRRGNLFWQMGSNKRDCFAKARNDEGKTVQRKRISILRTYATMYYVMRSQMLVARNES